MTVTNTTYTGEKYSLHVKDASCNENGKVMVYFSNNEDNETLGVTSLLAERFTIDELYENLKGK